MIVQLPDSKISVEIVPFMKHKKSNDLKKEYFKKYETTNEKLGVEKKNSEGKMEKRLSSDDAVNLARDLDVLMVKSIIVKATDAEGIDMPVDNVFEEISDADFEILFEKVKEKCIWFNDINKKKSEMK